MDHEGGFAEFLPAESGFRLDVEIDFKSPAIGRQRRVFDLDPATFRREIARARTFGFVSDVQALWQAGYALGSSLENSVAIDGDAILNPEGLRYADEFVRHKALDAVGDLSLAGAPIIGLYRTYRPGHKLNAHGARGAVRASLGLSSSLKRPLRQPPSGRGSAARMCPPEPRRSPPPIDRSCGSTSARLSPAFSPRCAADRRLCVGRKGGALPAGALNEPLRR